MSIAHAAFSPVFLDETTEHFGYILAPLAVLPEYQKNGVGSAIVKHGLDTIASLGAYLVFVYGDLNYYSRFGFKIPLAQNFTPPYTLKYPEGWHAMKLGSASFPAGGGFNCINSLKNKKLW